MSDSIYKVIELVGTSEVSWEEAAKKAVETAGKTLKNLRIAEIKNLDLKVMSPVDDLIDTDYENLSRKTYELIDKLIHQHKTTLIFTNTRSGTERVVHHLKQKFPKKYYEIDEGPPTKVSALIGAHHGSLSKRHR